MDEDGSSAPPVEDIPLHSTDLLTVLDADGVVRYESPAIERVLGFAPEDLVGEPVADYFHPEDRERVVAAFGRIVAAEGDAVESVEFRHETADGDYRWVESVGSANATPQGRYVINTRDVSDRRAREEELGRKNERLEAFTRVVSHDLRNPLSVAAGQLELARREHDDEHLAEVARALGRMEALIEDLLAVARGGGPVEAPETVELPAVVEDCWRTVDTGDASLAVDVDRTVRADRSRLRQLLANLLGNAVRHGGDGVTVTVGELPDRTGVYVADDGVGIPPDRRDRVFEGGYSTAESGTGFGLTIVTEVAEAHGWTVEVDESAAGGARFEVRGLDAA